MRDYEPAFRGVVDHENLIDKGIAALIVGGDQSTWRKYDSSDLLPEYDHIFSMIGIKITPHFASLYLKNGTVVIDNKKGSFVFEKFLCGIFAFGIIDGKFCVGIIYGNSATLLAIFIPEEKIVLYRRHKRSEFEIFGNLIVNLQQAVVECHEEFRDFLLSTKPKRGIQTSNPHLGHHLWNELSAIDQLDDAAVSAIDIVMVYLGSEIYANFDRIFPKFSRKIRRSKLLSPNIKRDIEQKYSIIPCASSFISADLAQRILILSQSEKSDLVDIFRRDRSILKVLMGLRVEERRWVDQAEGMAHVLMKLSDRFGSISVVFDGHNTGAGKVGSIIRSRQEKVIHHGKDSPGARKERQIISEIKQKLDDRGYTRKVVIYDTIMQPLTISISMGSICDIFISHWGAGLAKYKWILNMDGIVFAPNSMRRGNEINIYQKSEYRENAAPDNFVPEYMIRDQEIIGVEKKYRNFVIEIDELSEFVIQWIENNSRLYSINTRI